MDYDTVICAKPHVYIYKIPARSSNKSPRAADWDLSNPNWEGSLKIISKGNKLRIDLVDKSSGCLFGSCPIDVYPGPAVEGVSDSSRYFVLKLINDDGKHAFIGLGFADRSDSFDFNVTIQDFFSKDAKLEALKSEFKKGPPIDMRLKKGQKLNFDVSGIVNRNTSSSGSKNILSSRTPTTSTIKNTNVCTVMLPDDVVDNPGSTSTHMANSSSKYDNSTNDVLSSDLFMPNNTTTHTSSYNKFNNDTTNIPNTANTIGSTDLSSLFSSASEPLNINQIMDLNVPQNSFTSSNISETSQQNSNFFDSNQLYNQTSNYASTGFNSSNYPMNLDFGSVQRPGGYSSINNQNNIQPSTFNHPITSFDSTGQSILGMDSLQSAFKHSASTANDPFSGLFSNEVESFNSKNKSSQTSTFYHMDSTQNSQNPFF